MIRLLPLLCLLSNPAIAWTHGAAVASISPGSGSCPAESAMVRGSGFAQKAIGNFDEYPNVWIENTTHHITVGAAIGDRAWIQQVVFCLNGNSVTVSNQSVNPRTGSRGWNITPISGASPDGDYTLYAYIQPTNGYERRIALPIILNTNSTISRPVLYVNYTTGSDPANCTGTGSTQGTLAAPWKTFLKSMICATNGAIVYYATGQTYLEDSNTGTNNAVTRTISFRPLGAGTATVSRTTRTGSPSAIWAMKASMVEFDGITVDMSKIVVMQSGTTGSSLIFKNSFLVDPNGVSGPAEGYYNPTEITQAVFTSTNQGFYALVESTATTVVLTNATLLRNSTINISWDAGFFSSAASSNNTRFFNVASTQDAQFKTRLVLPTSVAIDTISYSAGTDRTTITWSGSPTMATVSAAASNAVAATLGQYVTFLSGALAGQDWVLFSQTPASFETVIVGDATAAIIGDTARSYAIAHADSFQFAQQATTAPVVENIYVQRLKAVGPKFQPIFSQLGAFTGSGTMSAVGTAVTFSGPQTLNAGDFISITNGAQQYEYRQVVAATSSSVNAVIDSPYSSDPSGRTWTQGKTAKDVAIIASIFDHTDTSAEISQIQHGNQHWVLGQVTHIGNSNSAGTPIYFRSANAGFGLTAFTAFDSIFYGMSTDAVPGFPSVGFNADNNQFEDGTTRGTNASTGNVTFNSNYKPTAGLSKAVRGIQSGALPNGTPLFPWAYDGTSISIGALIGAQQP